MPSIIELDKTSWSILACLQENARASFADIGREVGLSAPAVAERMIKLEESGIIQGYRIEVDYEKNRICIKSFYLFYRAFGKITSVFKLYQQTG